MRRPVSPAPAPSPRDLHAGEEGMLSLVSLFVVLAFLVLIGLLANAGLVTARKVETQNAADSAAYAAGTEMARGMNSLTALNHLIGELTALVVLIHTLGGDELDNGQPPSTPAGLEEGLDTAYQVASDLPGDVPVYDSAYTEASKDSQVGGAIYDARMRLKKVLTWAFEAHAIGSGVQQLIGVPFVGWLLYLDGLAISGAAWAFEFKVWQECETLDLLEEIDTSALNPFKKFLRDQYIPFVLYPYGGAIIVAAPFQARQAAVDVGGPNLAESSLYPMLPALPVQKEPPQPADKKKSQLMRATTPWVQWWREAWMQFGRDALRLSRFACAVQDRSNTYTDSIVKGLREDKNVRLYVLKDLDLNSSDKTQEKWMSDSSEADQLFTVVGLAHRPAPRVAAGGYFRQENPDGVVCYAQAMFYNANPQKPGSGDGSHQPVAGWDTLNWQVRVPEYRTNSHEDDCSDPPDVPQPLIRLNWRCKLVPTTRLTEATWLGFQPGPVGKVLRRTLPDNPFTLPRTH